MTTASKADDDPREAWEKNSTTDDTQSLQGALEDAVKASPCMNGWCVKWQLIIAIIVRFVLLVHASVAVWLVVSMTSDTMMWLLLISLVFLVVEGFYAIIRKKGQENRWFCPCFLAYLAAVLPPIWLVELDRLDRFNDALDDNSNLTSLNPVNGLTVPIRLEPEVWVSVMEQTLLFLLVLSRWLLPRGDITRHELSQLLFVLMGIASDNMELFELFDEPEVRQDTVLTYIILGVWSLSLLQFVVVLTATRSPRKSAVVHDQTMAEEETRADKKKKRRREMSEIIFASEIWSLMFSVMVQDVPYAATRIYTLVKYDLLTYSIIFFICKNLLIISLVLYRLMIICIFKCRTDEEEEEEEEEEEKGVKEKKENKGDRLLPRTIKVDPAPSSDPDVPLKNLNRDINSTDI